MKEIWKQIQDFENYEISNMGNIRSKKNGILKPYKDYKGYKRIVLYKRPPYAPTIAKSFFIHRLVLQTFSPNKQYKTLQVNHIDHDPSNNNLKNLEWVTPTQNCNRKKQKDFYHNSIGCRDELGNFFYSYREAAKYYHLSPNTVKNDCLGLTKRKTDRMTFHK